MGCLKLSYYETGEGIGKTAFFSGGRLEKKERALKNRYNYYPGGLTFNSYQRSFSKANNFKYNGKELEEETQLYDYGARFYDPALMRFSTIDPMSSERDWLTPYNYVQNNPILRIDPTGMLDDYYNEQGEFLFRDDKKTDYIKIVSEKGEALAGLVKGNGTDDYQNVLEGNSVGINEAGLSDEAASNVFTDILSKMDGVDTEKLHNGKVSVYNGKSDQDGNPAGANDPARPPGPARTSFEDNTNGDFKVTVNFANSSQSEFGTVSNVQNGLGVHEFIGHGTKRLGLDGSKHSEAYKLQMSHPSWRGTTPEFKKDMKARLNYYLERNE